MRSRRLTAKRLLLAIAILSIPLALAVGYVIRRVRLTAGVVTRYDQRKIGREIAIEKLGGRDSCARSLSWYLTWSGANSRKRLSCAELLAKCGERGTRLLLKMIKNADGKERLDLLVRLHGPLLSNQKVPSNTASVLIECMRDNDPKVRKAAYELFFDSAICFDAAAHESELVPLMESPDPDLRAFAISYLGDLGPDASEHLPAIRSMLGDDNPRIRCAVAYSIWRITAETESPVNTLVSCLKDQNRIVRFHAAYQLGLIGPPAKDAIPFLESLLQDKDKEVRNAAAEALEKITGKKTKSPPVVDVDQLRLRGRAPAR